MTTTYEFHPVADLFPMMPADEAEILGLDIAMNGLHEPILLAVDPADNIEKIADGRNRYNACAKAGVEPHYRRWNGEGSLVDIVVSLNLKRRHLSESQRAMVAQKLVTTELGSNQFKPGGMGSQICVPITQTKAAKLLNVSPRNISSAKKVARDAEPEIVEWVEQGDLSVSAAEELAELPKERQKQIVKKGRKAAKEILTKIREKAVRRAAHGKTTCLVCGPGIEDTPTNFLAALQFVGKVFPSHARYLADVIEEMAQEDLSDTTRANYDRILAAINAGDAEHNDCRKASGLPVTEFEHTIAVMLDYKMIEVFYQGGKTDTARGARKKIYRVCEAQPDTEDLTYEMFDEESDREFFGT